MRILDLHLSPDPVGLIYSYLFIVYNPPEIKYIHTAKWIKDNLVQGMDYNLSELSQKLYTAIEELHIIKPIPNSSMCSGFDGFSFFYNILSIIPVPEWAKDIGIGETYYKLREHIYQNGPDDKLWGLLDAFRDDGMSQEYVQKLTYMLYLNTE